MKKAGKFIKKKKTIKINKQEIEKVLGETWNITIGEMTITNVTEVDEDGNRKITKGIK